MPYKPPDYEKYARLEKAGRRENAAFLLVECLFERGDAARTAVDVALWWEKRLFVWGAFVSALYCSGVISVLIFSLAGQTKTRSVAAPIGNLIDALPITIALWLFVLMVATALYGSFCLIDIALRVPLRLLNWRVSFGLMILLLTSAILLASGACAFAITLQ